MHCEQCGREMKNAEMWQLATDPKAPTSWSMQQLCWECRVNPKQEAETVTEATAELEVPEFSSVEDFSIIDTDYDIALGVAD